MAYDLGIVIPVYRSKESVKRLVGEIRKIFCSMAAIRICLVDDSGDESISRYLIDNCMGPEVRIVTLEQNCGQQAAVLCGLEQMEPCRYYATIDDDMEQPPIMLMAMYREIQKGYDLVYGVPRWDNRRPVYRKLGSRMRDFLFSWIIGVPGGIKVSSLRIMRSDPVKGALGYTHGGFFYLSAALFLSAGKSGRTLRVVNMSYCPGKRCHGKSGYNFKNLMKLYGAILWHYGICKPGRQKGRDVYRIKGQLKKDRIMVLGGSNCQLHALKRAKEQGLDTVLVDYTEAPPASGVAGIHVKESTFDADACIRAAREYGVTGVMTMGTDQPVYTAARVGQAVKLPSFLSVDEAYSVTNKKRMKEILEKAGIPTARYRTVDEKTRPEELQGMAGPFVIKPLDSQGQRGIFKEQTPGGALARLRETLSFSRCREALVEEFYESDEVTVSGWIQNGRLFILTVTDRLLYPDSVHIGVCTGHRFPSIHMDIYEEISGVSEGVAEAFHLKNGPFYLQILIGREGIRVNELAARIGGAFEDVFIPWVSGFDILQAVIDGALGRKAEVKCLKNYRPDKTGKCVAVQLLFCRPGKVGYVTPLEELLKLPYVLDAGYNYGVGQLVPTVENATARFGHAVITGSGDNIGKRVDDFYRVLSVLSIDGDEMMERFYPGSGQQ